MLKVALTGGIASGKSSVAEAFRELGVAVIDTDRLARDVVRPGQLGLARLVEQLGSDILAPSGELDRRQLRERIFANTEARRRVEQLLHPLIRQQLQSELAMLDAAYAIIEIPLLVETRQASQYNRVLVVDVPEEVQIQRLVARDKVSRADAEAALQAQSSREQRLQFADDVIENTGSLEDLRVRVRELHHHYLELARRFASRKTDPSE